MLQPLLEKLNNRRVKGLATSTLWQMMPAFSSALLSLIVVKWFSFEIWGGVVAVIALQQIVNVVAAWGSKDFLQKSFANSPANFKEIFGVNFYSRSVFLLLIPLVYSLLGSHSIELFVWFSVLVFSRFVQQSTEVLVLINKRFSTALLID